MKNIFIIILVILLIGSISFGTFFYFKFKELSHNEDRELKTYNKSFNKNQVKNLIINCNVTNVLIEENKNNENIEVLAHYDSSKELLVNLENNTLKIEEHQVNSNRFFKFSKFKENIKISLPKYVINKLAIDSNVGNIDIKETLFNNLNLKSNVGNIKFTANEFPINTNITTSVGNVDINIKEPKSYMIKAQASVGNIKIYDTSTKGTFIKNLGNEDKKIFIDSNVGNIKVYYKNN